MKRFYSRLFLMKLSISISAGRAVVLFLDAVFALEQGLLRCDGCEQPHDGLYLLKVWLCVHVRETARKHTRVYPPTAGLVI